jgi:hypothetical protein
MWSRIFIIAAFCVMLAACIVTFGFMFGQPEIHSLVTTGHLPRVAQGDADEDKSDAIRAEKRSVINPE